MSNSSASARELVDKVLRNEIRLPEMQRGYVWKSTQVRDLIDSLYRGYPAGNILMWETSEEDMPDTRDFAVAQKDIKHSTYLLLLDGQQRVTSLSRLLQGETFNVRGQGGKLKEIDILFNMDHPDSLTNVDIEEDEEEGQDSAADENIGLAKMKDLTFMVANNRMRSEPNWVSVKDIFKTGNNTEFLKRAGITSFDDPNFDKFSKRLDKVRDIQKYEFHLITLDRKLSYEEVTEIFVRVNSLGTKLRGSDLALAQITAKWRGSLKLFEDFQAECENNGWDVSIGLIVRTLIAMITDQAKFNTLSSISKEKLENGWIKIKRAINFALDFLRNNVGIEGLSNLTSPYFIIVLAHMFDKKQYTILPEDDKKLTKWVILASAKGHYSRGSSETILNQDLKCETSEELLSNLKQQVINLDITEEEIAGKGVNSGYFRTMFMAMRHFGAKDWDTKLTISSKNIDKKDKIEYHHIIPKDLLKKAAVAQEKIDDMANLTFIGKITNIKISNNEPEQYLDKIIEIHGGDILKPHCIPMDKSLWKLDNYDDFLSVRRRNIIETIRQYVLEKTTLAD